MDESLTDSPGVTAQPSQSKSIEAKYRFLIPWGLLMQCAGSVKGLSSYF